MTDHDHDYEWSAVPLPDDAVRIRIVITRKPRRTVSAVCCICGAKKITDIAIGEASPFEATWVCLRCITPGRRAHIRAGSDDWMSLPTRDRSAYDRLAALGRALKEEARARRQ